MSVQRILYISAMSLNPILRWIIVAIVIIVLVLLLDAVVGLLSGLAKVALPILLILFGAAVILRFVGMFRARR